MGADLLLAWCDWPNVEDIHTAIEALTDDTLNDVRNAWAEDCGYTPEELQEEAAKADDSVDSLDSEVAQLPDNFSGAMEAAHPQREITERDAPFPWQITDTLEEESGDLHDSDDEDDDSSENNLVQAFSPVGWQKVVRQELEAAFEVLHSRCCAHLTIHGYDIAVAGDMSWGDEPDGCHEIILIGASGIGQIRESTADRTPTNGTTVRITLPIQ